MSEPLEETLRAVMRQSGIEYDGSFVIDGELHRFKANDDHGTNSWYALHPGSPVVGAFGCWKRGITVYKWCERNSESLPQHDRQNVHKRHQEISAKVKTETLARQKEAREMAASILSHSGPAPTLHRYLTRKRVKVYGDLRVSRRKLVLPLRDAGGELHSLQFIDDAGGKKFLRGGRVKGCFFTLADNAAKPLVICESYATGASIHEATGYAVISAMSSGNLLAVAKAARKLWPEREIIVAADNDQSTDGNPGLTKASAAAKAIGAKLAVPQFDDPADKRTDFNDLALAQGLDAVREQIGFAQRFAEGSPPPISVSVAQQTETDGVVTLDDFHAYMPTHSYIFVPARDFWPAGSVNARIKPVRLIRNGQPVLDEAGKQKFVSASAWLDMNQPVEQMTWAPGKPMLIEDRLISDGGWLVRHGCTTFNLYRPPQIKLGDPNKAGRWLKHVRRLYPKEAKHIILWLAHRVQRAFEKINHALFLGGNQGIGKDTLLYPVKYAVGHWNVQEILPPTLLGRFNGFVKSVILCINEAHDLGELDRFALYERLKAYTAAPPDVIRVDEKNLREYAVLNVCGVVLTSNHKTNGLYLPADDRRHFVAWSNIAREAFSKNYWQEFYAWYESGGCGHVAAFLTQHDISKFNPKAPPPKTNAFWEIVNSNRAPEDAELADALEQLGYPAIVTKEQIAEKSEAEFDTWLRDRKNARQVPYRFEACGYAAVRNPANKTDGRWKVGGKHVVIYAKRTFSIRDQLAAAQAFCDESRP